MDNNLPTNDFDLPRANEQVGLQSPDDNPPPPKPQLSGYYQIIMIRSKLWKGEDNTYPDGDNVPVLSLE